jgi:release factor glutamine methyltransferase
MVYEPQEDSYLLLEQVKKLAHGRVLDMGTGSGILALAAAEKDDVREVVAADIDSEAVKELRNRKLKKIKIVQSDLFMNIGGSFDVIIFNPPYLPDEERDDDVALAGGKKGHELIEKFLHGAKDYLNKNGFILIVFSNMTGKEDVDRIIKQEGYSPELLDTRSLAFFEELYVYKITPNHKKII